MLRWKERPFITSSPDCSIVMPVSIPIPARGKLPQSPLSSPSLEERSPPATSQWLVLLSAAAILAAIFSFYFKHLLGAVGFVDHHPYLENPPICSLSSIC